MPDSISDTSRGDARPPIDNGTLIIDEAAASAREAAIELCSSAKLKPGQTVVVGCSTSEVAGRSIGTSSSIEIGRVIFAALNDVFSGHGLFLAAQCCEHLNRVLILERAAAAGLDIVNAVPVPEAGGAFATAAYEFFSEPVAVEEIRADAGIDIGGTLIGMHLRRVAVPLRLGVSHIGKAPVVAARTRPKFAGGSRARYDEKLL